MRTTDITKLFDITVAIACLIDIVLYIVERFTKISRARGKSDFD